jgi:hypothetical protein
LTNLFLSWKKKKKKIEVMLVHSCPLSFPFIFFFQIGHFQLEVAILTLKKKIRSCNTGSDWASSNYQVNAMHVNNWPTCFYHGKKKKKIEVMLVHSCPLSFPFIFFQIGHFQLIRSCNTGSDWASSNYQVNAIWRNANSNWWRILVIALIINYFQFLYNFCCNSK